MNDSINNQSNNELSNEKQVQTTSEVATQTIENQQKEEVISENLNTPTVKVAIEDISKEEIPALEEHAVENNTNVDIKPIEENIDIQKLLEENQKLKEQLTKNNAKIKPKKNSKKVIIITLIIIITVVLSILGYLFLPSLLFDVNEFKKNIVLILTYDEYSNPIASGSGVYINNKTIYTNAHVLEDAKIIEVVLDNNMKVEVKGIQSINDKKDIAILVTEPVKTVKKLKTKSKVKAGTEVYAVGSPLGIKNAVSDGVISGEYNDIYMEEVVYQHTSPISSGSSGGALINKKGELIGINYATYTNGQNLNLAIMIDNFNKEYNNTKNDELIKVGTSSFFEIDELLNTPGKAIIQQVCNINTECNAFIDEDSEYEKTNEFKTLQKDLEHVIRIEAVKYYTQLYSRNDWLRIYIFKMKNKNIENDSVFKNLVEYKSLETRDYYYQLDFSHYWASNENYYYYIEYSKNIDITKIVNNLRKLTGGQYE